jgi:hypothetical protein
VFGETVGFAIVANLTILFGIGLVGGIGVEAWRRCYFVIHVVFVFGVNDCCRNLAVLHYVISTNGRKLYELIVTSDIASVKAWRRCHFLWPSKKVTKETLGCARFYGRVWVKLGQWLPNRPMPNFTVKLG